MNYLFRSRFVYGTGGNEVDWTTTYPVRAWDRRTSTVGGSRTAAGGVPAAYIVRRDHVIGLTVRILESEWSDLHGLLEWGQFGESFLWYPDAGGEVISDSFSVWLAFPKASEDIRPTRHAEYRRILEQSVELRSFDALPWELEYFAEPLT